MKKFKNVFLKFAAVFLAGIFIDPGAVVADTTLNVDSTNKLNLEAIKIPLFNTANTINFSIFSWLAFAGGLATVGLVIFWIYLMIRAGIKGLQSEGKPEGLTEAATRAKSVLIGMFITFLFPAILSIVGAFLGIGNIFQWPKMFSFCNNTSSTSDTVRGSTTYDTYYFQILLRDGKEKADAQCGQT